MNPGHFDWRFAVRFIGVLALVLVAFAHRPPALAPASGFDASAWAFPDGSVPVICVTLPTGEGQTPAGQRHALPCDACIVSAALAVPAPGVPAAASIEWSPVFLPRMGRVAASPAAWPPSAPPTAPPSA
ncbi:MAG: hypothetical protein AB7I79_00560 [Rhizobiaceae bacterium]